MKSQAFFIVALLFIAFTTQVYAASESPLSALKQDMIACFQDLYEVVQLGYRAYDAIKNENFVALIGIISEIQILGPKLIADCSPEQLF